MLTGNKPRAGRQKGFTLTEVMVAMAILSIAIVGLLSLISQNIRITTDMEDRLMAGIVAENILVETLAPFTLPENLVSEGDVEFAGQTWRWRRNVEETVIDGLFRVTVDVRRGSGDQAISTVTAFREGA